jgi:hypothetical protein
MLVYSVTINVDEDIHDEWLGWMTSEHLPDVIATGCFSNYRMYRLLSPETDGSNTYIIQYYCNTVEDYERYQIEHAAILQNEHKEKYGGKFTAFRTLMEEV